MIHAGASASLLTMLTIVTANNESIEGGSTATIRWKG